MKFCTSSWECLPAKPAPLSAADMAIHAVGSLIFVDNGGAAWTGVGQSDTAQKPPLLL